MATRRRRGGEDEAVAGTSSAPPRLRALDAADVMTTRGWDCARSMVSGGRPRRVKGGMRSRGGGGGVGDAAMGSADVGGGQSPIDDKVE